ncbi:hypothetical protein ABZX88_02195 [Kitasatospora aureofaciens]|uniref:hypothetical protein n=1 Tax=Kitasatospora aureofaciens TaxID=1894 RepID=UPI0033BD9758
MGAADPCGAPVATLAADCSGPFELHLDPVRTYVFSQTERLKLLLASFADGLDIAHHLDDFTTDLTDVTTESIGPDVWPGLDRYLADTAPTDHWTRNFLPAWRHGLLDYHLVAATRAA